MNKKNNTLFYMNDTRYTYSTDYNYLLKFILIGESQVGKTCLIKRLIDDTFSEYENIPTLGIDFNIKLITLKNNKIAKIQLCDTAGQERFRSIVSSYYKGMDGAIICFDLNKDDSLKHVSKWLYGLNQRCKDDLVKILVGTKSDLKQTVTQHDIDKFCNKHNLNYIETSSKNGTGCAEVFNQLIEDLIDQKGTLEITSDNNTLQLSDNKKTYTKCCN